MEGKDIKNEGVEIMLDKKRHLVYDMNAYCMFEDKYGSITDAFKAFETGSIHKVRWLLWVGLQHNFRETGESLTEEDIGSYIDTPQKMNEAHSLISVALFGSAPESDGKQKTPSKSGGQQTSVGKTDEHKQTSGND